MITELQPLMLNRLPRLHTLFLQSNLLTGTEGLAGLGALQHLVLDRNRIRLVTLETLSACPSLAELYLVANRVSAIDEIGNIRGLERLHMSCNNLTQLEDILQLGQLERLLDVTFDHNPCSRDVTFRAQLILVLPRVCFIDRKEVTLVHRELAIQWQADEASNAANEAGATNQMWTETIQMGMPAQVGPTLTLNGQPDSRFPPRPTNSQGKRSKSRFN